MKRVLGCAVILALLGSCAPGYVLVGFQVLEPGNVTLDPGAGPAVIINRAPITFDVMAEENRTGLTEEHLVIIDTVISNSLIRGVQDVLRKSPASQFHYPIFDSERRFDTLGLNDLVLTKREVEEICTQHAGNVLISLEKYTLEVETYEDMYPDEPGTLRTHYFQLSGEVTWRVYLPGHPRPYDAYVMSDTMYFSNVVDGRLISERLSPIDMIRLFYKSCGEKYARRLVPVWSETLRPVFSDGDKSLRQAARYTNRGDWEQARFLWEGLCLDDDPKTSSRAYHNLAVYYELEDSLDTALIFARKAMALDTMEAFRTYGEELETRVLNRKEILEQLY
ncbi:MAG: DUF6340 family protein [Bacteroidales bacterium]